MLAVRSIFVLISIHALREEGDQGGASTPSGAQDFYPRPPRGGRHSVYVHVFLLIYFYPRPPRGGRPTSRDVQARYLIISIHALREEGDLEPTQRSMEPCNFYPRPPRGGRQLRSATLSSRSVFLSTPSARRATSTSISVAFAFFRFLSTPSARRATCPCR